MIRVLYCTILIGLLSGCSAGIQERECPMAPKSPRAPTPQPKPKPKPWGNGSASVDAAIGGRVSPDGSEEIQCDLPGRLHIHNKGGSDGAGLCVFASIHHTGEWQDDEVFRGLFEFMRKYPGGGYPQKVDRMIEKFCKEKGYAKPDYLQVEDGDMEILRAACRNGLMPGVTYSRSPTGRYNGQRIAHMVSLPHCTEKWVAILDNNYPGDDKYEWLSPAEFKSTFNGSGRGWAVILLRPSPPPVPHGGKR